MSVWSSCFVPFLKCVRAIVCLSPKSWPSLFRDMGSYTPPFCVYASPGKVDPRAMAEPGSRYPEGDGPPQAHIFHMLSPPVFDRATARAYTAVRRPAPKKASPPPAVSHHHTQNSSTTDRKTTTNQTWRSCEVTGHTTVWACALSPSSKVLKLQACLGEERARRLQVTD